VTTASRTALMNIATGTWDARLAELFGVPIDTLPPIVPTTGDFGAMDIDGRGVPVRASIVDQQAALYGHGCRAAGDAKITFGTGAFALAVTGNEPLRAPEKGLLPTVAWQRDGEAASYAIDGAVYTASAAVNWARGLGLFEHFDEIGAFDGPPAIERGLVFVPALTGLACPHWDRAARGTWLGLSLDTTRLDLVRAILEGVAMRAAEVLRAMHALVPRGGVVSIDGGLTRNPCFCQFLADAVGQPVRINDDAELTALGTARLVAESLGAVVATGGSTHVVEPRALAAGCHERFAEAVAVTRRWPLPAEAR
ncbi:MAG: glycerol kinase, partial [Planctomycetes bacterium]|nr:glycerol kinase [Planctomycetota bacterium]